MLELPGFVDITLLPKTIEDPAYEWWAKEAKQGDWAFHVKGQPFFCKRNFRDRNAVSIHISYLEKAQLGVHAWSKVGPQGYG